MRCSGCGNGCKRFTRSGDHEKEIDVEDTSGHGGYGGVHCDWRRDCAPVVELAGADAVWVEADYVLAGAGAASALPHFVWRIRHAWRQKAGRLARWYGRTMREYEPRGAREVSRTATGTLGAWRDGRGNAGAVSTPDGRGICHTCGARVSRPRFPARSAPG